MCELGSSKRVSQVRNSRTVPVLDLEHVSLISDLAVIMFFVYDAVTSFSGAFIKKFDSEVCSNSSPFSFAK